MNRARAHATVVAIHALLLRVAVRARGAVGAGHGAMPEDEVGSVLHVTHPRWWEELSRRKVRLQAPALREMTHVARRPIRRRPTRRVAVEATLHRRIVRRRRERFLRHAFVTSRARDASSPVRRVIEPQERGRSRNASDVVRTFDGAALVAERAILRPADSRRHAAEIVVVRSVTRIAAIGRRGESIFRLPAHRRPRVTVRAREPALFQVPCVIEPERDALRRVQHSRHVVRFCRCGVEGARCSARGSFCRRRGPRVPFRVRRARVRRRDREQRCRAAGEKQERGVAELGHRQSTVRSKVASARNRSPMSALAACSHSSPTRVPTEGR